MWSVITFVMCATCAMALAMTIVAARRRIMVVKQSIFLWPAVACAILVLLALLDGAVTFDPAQIDGVLHALGREPWVEPRPRVAALVAVRQGSLDYMTSTDGPHGYGQVDALTDAAARTGLAVMVPSQTEISHAGLDDARLRTADTGDLSRLARQLGADIPLLGDMTFSDAAGGWIVEWRFLWQGTEYRWHVTGVNFDAAFLNGLRGVAQIASGHGSP